MTILVWDEVGSRTYETGLDRGAIYLTDGQAMPWNGLIDVDEDPDVSSTPVYYDGRQISQLVTFGRYKGKIKAVTYPDIVSELEGSAKITYGMLLGQQKPKMFNLAYRTLVGSDVDGDSGHKIHLLYNVIMTPTGKKFSTISDDVEAVNFEWDISAIPEEVEGFKPTAYVSLDSRLVPVELMTNIEKRLWGSGLTDPEFIPLGDFVNYLYFEYKWKIVDNGDGTFTAITPDDSLLEANPLEANMWDLHEVDATYLAPNVFTLKDSLV